MLRDGENHSQKSSKTGTYDGRAGALLPGQYRMLFIRSSSSGNGYEEYESRLAVYAAPAEITMKDKA